MSHIPYECVQGTDEEHGSGRDPESRCPGAVLANGAGEQHRAGKNAEGRDESADAVGHTDIITDNLGQRERSELGRHGVGSDVAAAVHAARPTVMVPDGALVATVEPDAYERPGVGVLDLNR
ncbi:hypothetical protein [Streptomyces sp. DH24]|uniref:hypothetical protein n=1 Tax=Streptomyces sp. DH24 TaxID=3040123 RepID=UPI002443089E|nr:hypothetical protein [Streptomyces sp. DH24]MDG9716732.1 hypothetical protein [Streptomyces sp. DH24]